MRPPRGRRATLQPGTRWVDGRYRIERWLGGGTLATAYAATDTLAGRVVELRVFDAVMLQTKLLHAARRVALVEHERIARVYDVGTHDDFAFIAMEYVPGSTLRQWMTGRQVPWPQAVDIATQIAEGLAELHRRGMVHRNLEPENVMLTAQGRIKLLRVGEWDEPRGRPGIGSDESPLYMSPEQLQSGRSSGAGARSDIWALGVLLYELVTGEPPLRGNTPRQDMDLTRRAWASTPTWLRSTVDRMLAIDPRERFADGGELLAALRESTSMPSEPVLVRLGHWPVANAVFVLFLLATVAVLWLTAPVVFIGPLLISAVMVVLGERIAAGATADSTREAGDGHDA